MTKNQSIMTRVVLPSPTSGGSPFVDRNSKRDVKTIVAHKQMSIFRIQRFDYNIQRFIECILLCKFRIYRLQHAYKSHNFYIKTIRCLYLLGDKYKFNANVVRDHKITKINHFVA